MPAASDPITSSISHLDPWSIDYNSYDDRNTQEFAPIETDGLGVPVNEAKTIWTGFLRGQLANVAKAALWWSTFGILTASMLKSDIALAVTRGSFNLALLLSSPLAVAASERVSIRRLLLMTTSGRLVIWSLFIPVAWIVLGHLFTWTVGLWLAIIVLMFLDGLQVAFSNAVDIDCGGLDSLSLAYNLPLTDFLRYRFTTIHQLVFDSSFIVFTPPVMVALVWISLKLTIALDIYDIPNWIHRLVGPDSSTLVLALGVAFFFSILSFISLYYYHTYIPKQSQPRCHQLRPSSCWPLSAPENESYRNSFEEVSLWKSYKKKIQEVADGLIVVLSDRALKWRLVLLATETALEDTMVSVIIPMIGLNMAPLLANTADNTMAALISVITIAVGKFGGVLASVYLASRWEQNSSSNKTRKRLFLSVLFSSISLCLVPWGCWAIRNVVSERFSPTHSNEAYSMFVAPSKYVGISGVLIGIFFFFVFSTAPKIGFAALIQKAVSEDEKEAMEVFGFVGMFVTIIDGVMIIFVNLIFSYLGRDRFDIALCIVIGIYLLHGIIEWHKGMKWIQEVVQL